MNSLFVNNIPKKRVTKTEQATKIMWQKHCHKEKSYLSPSVTFLAKLSDCKEPLKNFLG